MKRYFFIMALFFFTMSISSLAQSHKHSKRPHDVDPDSYIENTSVQKAPLIYNREDAPLIFTNVNISNNLAPQNEPSVRISRKNTNRVVAAWRDFRLGMDPNAVRRVGYSFSTDGGMTWSISALLDSTLLGNELLRNSDPAVATDTAGNFYVTTIALNNSNGNGTLAIYKSTDQGVTFPIASVISMTGSEDKEYITCDLSPISPFKNNLYISWTSFSLGGMAFTRSTDGGTSWSAPIFFNNDTTFGQGSDICVSQNGQINIVWGDGNTVDDIVYVKSTDGGLTFSVPQVIAYGPQPFNLPNGAVTFPSIAAGINPNGGRGSILYCTYCDASLGDADIFLVRSTDNGNSWLTPQRINNDAIGNGKIQYWPWISVNELGNVAIAFLDTRNTPDLTTIEAWLARSNDLGVTFTNELMSTQQSTTNTPGSNVRFGDYIGIDYQGSHVVTVWPDERAGGFNIDIYTAVVDQPVGINPGSNGLPVKFELKQNYPNPFNPNTTIWFALPKAAYVNLSIYNEMGQLVETPIDESLGAGSFSVKWDGSRYASGIYFYKLSTSEGFSETKKMILVK